MASIYTHIYTHLNMYSRFGHAFEQRFYAVVGRNAKDG